MFAPRPPSSTLRRFVWSWLLVGLVTATSDATAAPKPSEGQIVLIRSKHGGYLSAREGVAVDGVAISANKDAWEQWRYGAIALSGSTHTKLVSFHGTTLIYDSYGPGTAEFTVTHLPYFAGDLQRGLPVFCRVNAEGACNWDVDRDQWGIGDEVAIVLTFEKMLLHRDAAGVVTSKPFAKSTPGFGVIPVPNDARWIVEAAPNPASNRKPERVALDYAHHKLKSAAHGTYLSATGEDYTSVSHGSSGWSVTARCTGKEPPLRFGWLCTVREGSGLVALPSAQTGGSFGLPLATWTKITIGRELYQHTLVPCAGGWAAGERIPVGVTLCLQHTRTGKYLSAEPGGIVTWSANSSGWEQWVIE